MKRNVEASADERIAGMGQEKILKLLFRFSAPAIIAMEAGAGYELFDAVWSRRLGAEALAALTVADPLMAIYRAVGSGIGVGSASLIARHLGAGKKMKLTEQHVTLYLFSYCERVNGFYLLNKFGIFASALRYQRFNYALCL